MLPTALPVLWKDGDRSGINGVVQVHQSDLQFRDAKIRDLVAVLNTKIPKPSGSSRAVQSVLLYGARLSSDRRLDAIVPDLAGSSPRLMATMGSPPSTTLDVVIVVDTLTGKMTRVPFNPKVSVADVKQRLQDMEGIPQNDQIFVVNNARLEDNRALESYNIHNGSLIYLVWKLKRGYISPRSVGGGLDDVVQANHETTAASRWRIAYEGLNVEGRCTNEYCAAFQRMVIRPYQFESFNLVREGSILCPVCHCPVKPLTCGFLNCAWKFDGIRAGNGLSISSPWRDASGTRYHHFSADEKHDCSQWESLLVVVKQRRAAKWTDVSTSGPANREDICAICWAKLWLISTTTNTCGHHFHRCCFRKWVKWCSDHDHLPSCPVCRKPAEENVS